jgi:hypothetical protein
MNKGISPRQIQAQINWRCTQIHFIWLLHHSYASLPQVIDSPSLLSLQDNIPSALLPNLIAAAAERADTDLN